jgi:hypothetical protein
MNVFLGIVLCWLSFSWADITQDSLIQANSVDSLHQGWIQNIQTLDSSQFTQILTQESNLWFENLERSIKYDRKEDLEKAPFSTIVSVMTVRMYLRADSLKDDRAPAIKQFLLQRGHLPKVFNRIKWGPARVEGREFTECRRDVLHLRRRPLENQSQKKFATHYAWARNSRC